MKKKLLEILVCPKCQGPLECQTDKEAESRIIEGKLICSGSRLEYPVKNGIPRFVTPENYASSFGYQWNLFRKEQIDSINGLDLSARRFWSETGWPKDELQNQWILDAGCGAGRFLDVVSQSKAEIVGIDISHAIDAAMENLQDKENVHFIQASIYELPFKDGTFDKCYCIGVIQHTPDPARTLQVLARQINDHGELAVTIYEKKLSTLLNTKYLIRPLTKKISNATLLKIIKTSMPVVFPVTNFLFRLPVLGRAFSFFLPVANYVNERALSAEQRYNWALLDTFDMLSPQYDKPQTEKEAVRILNDSGMNYVERLPNTGLNLIGRKHSK